MKSLSFSRLLALSILSLMAWLPWQAIAQGQGQEGGQENGQNAASQVKFFEGTMKFTIRLSGKMAADFAMSEPPKNLDMHIKEDNFIIQLYGGAKPKTFLFIGDSNHTYIVDAMNKRAYYRDYFQEDTTAGVPKAVPTGKTAMVGKELCTEYKVTKPGEQIFYYVSDKYRINLNKYANKDDAKASFLTEGLDGRIPLKTIIKTPDLTTETVVNAIQPKALEIENFRIPSDFKLKPRDHR
jgi:hypothetical protein